MLLWANTKIFSLRDVGHHIYYNIHEAKEKQNRYPSTFKLIYVVFKRHTKETLKRILVVRIIDVDGVKVMA